MRKSKKINFSKTRRGKWNFFYTNSRYIPKVYPSCLVRVISTHTRRIKLASFGRKYCLFSAVYAHFINECSIFATKTRQFYSSSMFRNKANQATGIDFRYVSRMGIEKNPLSSHRFRKKFFFRFQHNSLRISREDQISTQNARKNACSAPCLYASRIRYTRNFCKIFICGDISMFRRLNS